MTTIAWDGRTLAADRRCSSSNGILDVGKIFPLPNGAYLAGAGEYDDIVAVADWIAAGRKEKSRPKLGDDGSDLLLVEGGKAYWLTWPHLRAVEFREGFAAVGSGSGYALGAMAAGCCAREAVEIAARFDCYTGGPVDVVKP